MFTRAFASNYCGVNRQYANNVLNTNIRLFSTKEEFNKKGRAIEEIEAKKNDKKLLEILKKKLFGNHVEFSNPKDKDKTSKKNANKID